jgi:hypothetical protein
MSNEDILQMDIREDGRILAEPRNPAAKLIPRSVRLTEGQRRRLSEAGIPIIKVESSGYNNTRAYRVFGEIAISHGDGGFFVDLAKIYANRRAPLPVGAPLQRRPKPAAGRQHQGRRV